jgi:HEAT repeat protein
MSGSSEWGLTPRQSIEAECARRGKDAVVEGCVALLAGRDTDAGLVLALGGPGAARVITGENKQYWLRVWGARGLLWAWDDIAAAAVTAALRDDHWRVREMACKVIARHQVGDALPIVADLRDDPVPRVRNAAARTMVLLTEASA